MRIMLGGSFDFAKKLAEIKSELESKGHAVFVSDDFEEWINSPKQEISYEEELRICKEYDALGSAFKHIKESDIFLVCNYEKKGILGYLGVSALMEIAVAYSAGIKTYLLYPLDRSQKYAVEVESMQPTILNGDISKLE